MAPQQRRPDAPVRVSAGRSLWKSGTVAGPAESFTNRAAASIQERKVSESERAETNGAWLDDAPPPGPNASFGHHRARPQGDNSSRRGSPVSPGITSLRCSCREHAGRLDSSPTMPDLLCLASWPPGPPVEKGSGSSHRSVRSVNVGSPPRRTTRRSGSVSEAASAERDRPWRWAPARPSRTPRPLGIEMLPNPRRCL